MQPKSIWIIWVVWILVAGFVRGEQLSHGERILDFDSVIEVLGDASLTVTETITVVARQVHIKRGIYREYILFSFFRTSLLFQTQEVQTKPT